MSEDNYSNLKELINSGNLEELINLHKNGILTREVVEKSNFALFFYACEKGKLKICQWMYKTFQIIKEEAMFRDNYAFQQTCAHGHSEVCQWLYKTFQITKKEAMLRNNCAFYYACANNHYHIISFLCNTFGITEEDVKDIIKRYTKEKQEKIVDCFISFGSFTKPVKNK